MVLWNENGAGLKFYDNLLMLWCNDLMQFK